jgi:type IV pilus assembly protein PilC
MAEFVCKVGDSTGRVFQQVEAAPSEAEARHRLAEKGFHVYSIRAQLGLLNQFSRARRDKVVRSSDFLIFNQQFNTLIKAGLPILRALDLLAERAAAPRLRPVLIDVRDRVRDGAMLSESLVAQGLFPSVYTTSVLAGEKSGNLTGVLDNYIAYQRVSVGFRNRLKTVLIYPSILVVAVISVLSFLVTYAVPQFAILYTDLNVPLPSITKIVLAISLPIRNYLFVIIAVAATGIILAFLWSRSEQGALALERLRPKVPLLGDIWLKAQVAQFVRTLSTLLAGGTPLVTALDTAANSIGSRLISTSVRRAASQVREGQSLHSSLAAGGLIPGMALEMIEVGESSGALTAMLASVADFYEEEVNLRLTGFLAWIEPVILVFMAVVVAFILIALYLPMFSLSVGAGSS